MQTANASKTANIPLAVFENVKRFSKIMSKLHFKKLGQT